MYVHFIKRSVQAGYIMVLLLPHKQARNELLFSIFFPCLLAQVFPR